MAPRSARPHQSGTSAAEGRADAPGCPTGAFGVWGGAKNPSFFIFTGTGAPKPASAVRTGAGQEPPARGGQALVAMKVGRRARRLLQLRHVQLPVVVQQAVERLQHVARGQVELVQHDPVPVPHRLHQRPLLEGERARRVRHVRAQVLGEVRVLVVVQADEPGPGEWGREQGGVRTQAQKKREGWAQRWKGTVG